MAPVRNNNAAGVNGNGRPALERWPQLPGLIEEYVRDSFTTKQILEDLVSVHKIVISKATVDRIKQQFQIPSVRRNPKSDAQLAQEVVEFVAINDPTGAIGTRDLKNRLADQGTFVAHGLLRHVLKNVDGESQEKRNLKITNKRHQHGLWSAGPGEEWGFDQHEKLAPEMGIGVYGGVDKFSREPLAYRAVSRWHQRDVGASVFLLALQKKGGFPMTSKTDMGAETTDMYRISLSLREHFNPVLDITQIPPHVHTDSRSNIVTEQKWKDIFKKDLNNVKHFYVVGKDRPTFSVDNAVHLALARWLWAQAVQYRLDEYVRIKTKQKIAWNKKTLLPTGATPYELATYPQRWGAQNMLTPLPQETIDLLVRDYYKPDVFQFGTDEEVAVYEDVFARLSCPPVHWTNAWNIYDAMIPHVEPRFA
ncbi:hypothetical protein EXIGLDRAFT_708816 [Exidia glandulosa HHB12029]|uniref:Integrase core domain-containing protein n=1 Tax=Exidia glandulosa HHB12029 TaxID=1314781 RepID=A0A165J6C7_EXIGL|nr:hypothetical protein EXIGLDRAFT_708816 [Exidia glandulosa HHB12029]